MKTSDFHPFFLSIIHYSLISRSKDVAFVAEALDT